VTELSRYVLETLWEDLEFVLSRGVREGEPSPLLVVAPASGQPAPGEPRAAGAAGSARSTRCSRQSTGSWPGAHRVSARLRLPRNRHALGGQIDPTKSDKRAS
jgi:hypothetical protein